jgi:glutamate synthase (NADPH/NADH) large chain
MSSRTVVYKGLLLADQVGTYYLDLQDKRCVSALGLVHQRFSTNTFPEWPLAHPYAMSRTTAKSTRSRATTTG